MKKLSILFAALLLVGCSMQSHERNQAFCTLQWSATTGGLTSLAGGSTGAVVGVAALTALGVNQSCAD